MQQLLEFIIKSALQIESGFEVEMTEDEQGIVFNIQVPELSRGKLIGKEGRNIKAIRDLINIIARREQKRIFLKIAD